MVHTSPTLFLSLLQTRGQMRMVAANVLGMPSKKDSLVIRIRDLSEATGGQVWGWRKGEREGGWQLGKLGNRRTGVWLG